MTHTLYGFICRQETMSGLNPRAEMSEAQRADERVCACHRELLVPRTQARWQCQLCEESTGAKHDFGRFSDIMMAELDVEIVTDESRNLIRIRFHGNVTA